MNAAFSTSDSAPPQEVKVKGRSARASRGRPPRPVSTPAAEAAARNSRLLIVRLPFHFSDIRHHSRAARLPARLDPRPTPQASIGDLPHPDIVPAIEEIGRAHV